MLRALTNDPTEIINFINSLCQLGVSYYFETEIEEQLNRIFESQSTLLDDNDYDLQTTSLIFRVFRQHGYKISSSSFNKFKDNDGQFKEILTNEAKEMLSLYEAAHLRLHGEDILEEALAFSKAHLKSIAEKASPDQYLAKQIINALEMPLHKAYQDWKHSIGLQSGTIAVPTKAQPPFKLVGGFGLAIKAALHKRYRVVEAYMRTVMIYYEPCYWRARLILCKLTKVITFVDDTYDSYATFEELQSFADAVQRWDISALDDLPDYMKIVYSYLLNFVDEITDNDMIGEERSSRISHTKETLKGLFTTYFVEAEWLNRNYVPPFDEYVRNGSITIGMFAYTASSILGMGEEIAGINAFEWLQSGSKILRAAYLIARIKTDLKSHKVKQKRAHTPCSLEIYMNETGLSMEETIEKFNIMFENAWKDINEECIKPTAISMEIILRFVNFARLAEISYKEVDGCTHLQHFKDYVTKLFVDQIPI